MSFSGLNTFLFLWGKVRFVQTNLGWGGVQGKSARKESLRNGTLLSPEETPQHGFSLLPSTHS